MVYLLKMLIFRCKLLNNQMVSLLLKGGDFPLPNGLEQIFGRQKLFTREEKHNDVEHGNLLGWQWNSKGYRLLTNQGVLTFFFHMFEPSEIWIYK